MSAAVEYLRGRGFGSGRRPTQRAAAVVDVVMRALGPSSVMFPWVTPAGGIEIEVETPIVDVTIAPDGIVDVWAVDQDPTIRLGRIEPSSNMVGVADGVHLLISAAG